MKNHIQNALIILPLALIANNSVGFELISEGDMGSVSASAVGHFHDIRTYESDKNVRYELMPFETSVYVEYDDTDEVSIDMEREFALEVEDWAVKLQANQTYQNEISTIEAIQTPLVEDFEIDDSIEVDEQITEISLGQNTEDIRFQLGRVTQTSELLESQENSVRYTVESFVEQAATLNANPFQEEHTFGSTYITNLKSVSNVTITAN